MGDCWGWLAPSHCGLQRLLCGLSAMSVGALTTAAMPTAGPWLPIALTLDGLSCAVGLLAVHKYRAANLAVSDCLLSVCISLALVIYGIAHHSSSSVLPYPCLPAAMLLWCQALDLPAAAYILLSLVVVVVPVVFMPAELVTPVPLTLVAGSVLSAAVRAIRRYRGLQPPPSTSMLDLACFTPRWSGLLPRVSLSQLSSNCVSPRRSAGMQYAQGRPPAAPPQPAPLPASSPTSSTQILPGFITTPLREPTTRAPTEPSTSAFHWEIEESAPPRCATRASASLPLTPLPPSPPQPIAKGPGTATERVAPAEEYYDDRHSAHSTMSHDLRTPLTTALTTLQLLLDSRAKLSETEHRELLQQVWSALQSSLMGVNNMLDFSSAHQNSGIRLVRRPVDVRRFYALYPSCCKPLFMLK